MLPMAHRRSPQGRRPLPLTPLVVAVVLLPAVPALAAIQWHPDLATARAAARISQRPVLAVFTAGWNAASNDLEKTSLASPEAEAVLTACFEPVRIDIDAHPELIRRLGVAHVPTACLLGDEDTPLSTFEIPDNPPAFVAAAVRAAQQAAAGSETPAANAPSAWAAAGDATAQAFASAGIGPRNAETAAAGPPSKLKSKVRQLSAFASGEPLSEQPQADVPPMLVKAPPQAPPPQPAAARRAGWPAEVATAPPTEPMAPARPSLEPVSTASATVPGAVGDKSPWLSSPAEARGGAAAATPSPSLPAPAPAVASSPAAPTTLPTQDPAAAAPLRGPAEAARPPAAPPNPFVAAFQNPLGWFGKNKPAAATPPPPTMPPALSQSGPTLGGIAAAVAPPPAAAGASAPDAHGSMPLGLEGYCPVTLADRGTWVEGRAQWGARHRGRTYLFAGAEQQQAFLANPDRYAPALSGDDPVLAFESARSTPGQRRYGVTYQSRIYLFATPESRTRFTTDPGRYTARVAIAEAPAGIVRR